MNAEAILAPPVRARSNVQELAAWREQLLTATGRAAERMLKSNLDPAAIQEALGVLGVAARVSRVYVFEFSRSLLPDDVACSQVFEWCAPAIAPQIDNPDLQQVNLRAAGFGRWLDELAADRPVYGCVCEFPESERAMLEAQSIRSLAVVPVFRQGELWGMIGFDQCEHATAWTSDIVGCLQVAARILGAALERRHYKTRSESLQAEYQELIENLDNVVFRLEANGMWSFLSPAWETQLGWSVPESLGRRAAEFILRDQRRHVLDEWRRFVRGEKLHYRGEIQFRCANGSARWMLVNARALPAAPGRLPLLSGTLTDVTAAKDNEAALIAARASAEAANKGKSEFLSTMSHELRTPLNGVIGLSESLLEQPGPFEPERTRRYLSIIHQSGRQLLAQINDILDLARIEAGRVRVNAAPFDLAALVNTLAESIRRDAAAKKLQVSVDRPPGPFFAVADERLIRQIFQNLLSNAVKFTPEGGRINLRLARQDDGRVLLEVTDTGIGIPAEKRDQLFKPFSQLDSSLGRKFGGTGLGLALVDRLARLHEASITVRSEVGAGSTFSLLFPASIVPRTPDVSSGPAVILLDDNATQQAFVRDAMERHGFRVVQCEAAGPALSALRANAPRLLIVDLAVSGLDGAEFIRSVRRQPEGAALSILALTALGDSADVERVRQAGATLTLSKPLSLAALLPAVRQLIAPKP